MLLLLATVLAIGGQAVAADPAYDRPSRFVMPASVDASTDLSAARAPARPRYSGASAVPVGDVTG